MNNTFGHNPENLNFAFAGTLELSIQGSGMDPAKAVVLKDIFFALGHSGTSNNWWFGGLHCKQFGAWSAVKCTSDNYKDMTFTFVRGRVGQQGFNAYDDVDLYINEEPH